MEELKGPEEQQDWKLELKMDPSTDRYWYVDRTGQVIMFDDAQEAEINRQQMEPHSDPMPGYPKYPRMFSTEDVPYGAAGSPELKPEEIERLKQFEPKGDLDTLPTTPAAVAPEPTPPAEPTPGPTPEPALDPLHFRPSAMIRGQYTHPSRPGEVFTHEDVAREQQRAAGEAAAAPGARREIGGEALTQPQESETFTIQEFGAVPRFVDRKWYKEQRNRMRQPLVQAQPPAMDAILGDKKKQANFYRLLETFGATDLAEKYERSRTDPRAMSENDWQELRSARLEFDQRSKLAEEMRQGMSIEDVRALLRNTPEFAFLEASVSPERAMTLIKQNLDSIFMSSDGDEINAMVHAQRANARIRSSKHFTQMRERIERKTRIRGASPDNIAWTPALRQQLLRPGLTEVMRGYTRNRGIETIRAIQANQAALMSILGASISEDLALRSAIIGEATEGTAVPEVAVSGPDRAGAGVERRMAERDLDINALRAKVPEFKRTYQERFGRTWESDSVDAKLDNMLSTQRAQRSAHERRRSWFGSILASFIDKLMNTARGDTQLRSALAAA